MNYKLVQVDWLDHCSHTITQWREVPEIKELKPVLCHTVGYVLHETDEFITVGQTLSISEDLEDTTTGDMLILKACIKHIKEINLGE